MTKRSKPRSPTVKFDIVVGSHGLHGDALVAYCHQHGVTVSELVTWRDLALSGIELIYRDENGITRKEDSVEVIHLKEDLRRKNEALAEAAALLILQKKTSEILGGLK
jgi:hypothetical protein